MNRNRFDLLLALAATIAAGALYAIHPDDTARTVLVGAGSAFLALLRPHGSTPTTPPPPIRQPDTYTELPSAPPAG